MEPTTQRLSRRVNTLLSLLEVSRHGSINRAAEALHISQPALTRNISHLEDELGIALLNRMAKGVVPTNPGLAVLAHARAIEAELNNLVREVAALKQNETAPLRIGATPIIASFFLATGLKAIHRDFQSLPVRVVESTRPHLLGMLRREELDLVVSTFPFDAIEEDLDQEPLFELDLQVIVRGSHPLAHRDNLTPIDFAPYQWILPQSDHSLCRRVAKDFRRAGINFNGSSIETTSLEATKSMVRGTDLVAILPPQAIESELADKTMAALSGDWSFERRTVGLFSRTGERNPAYQSIMQALRVVRS